MMQRKFILHGGALDFDPVFLSQEEADSLFKFLKEMVDWEQKYYTNYRTGGKFPQPRLTAWYADDPKMTYSYSGITQKVQYWLPELLQLKDKIEKATGANFNSVLLNHYRNGKDSVGMHADDEKELGNNATIASISLGDTRKFYLECYRKNPNWQSSQQTDLNSNHEYELTHGSLLVMSGTTQQYWKHEIPKEILTARQIGQGVKPVGPRINLTFRLFTV